jgi:SH3-like domain-containing protein
MAKQGGSAVKVVKPGACCRFRQRAFAMASGVLLAVTAHAADFRTTSETATLLYDGPSAKARPLFVYGRDVPLEVLVAVEGWTKLRDVAGTIGWVPNKSLAEKRILLVRVPMADVRGMPDDAAPLVFRAEKDVLLELAESASSPAMTAAPGWVKVRHRDGQIGFVRLNQVFGF